MNIYWKPLFDRICAEIGYLLGNHKDGLVAINIRVLVGRDNQPVMWTVDGRRIEPSCNKEEILKLFTTT